MTDEEKVARGWFYDHGMGAWIMPNEPLSERDARIRSGVLHEVERELGLTYLANEEADTQWQDGFYSALERVRALATG